ncbi:hypothetical protein M0804_002125 [Polistes exclamans]|nr:hypothetical protein M0804_002125 [Polistes exclamans]
MKQHKWNAKEPITEADPKTLLVLTAWTPWSTPSSTVRLYDPKFLWRPQMTDLQRSIRYHHHAFGHDVGNTLRYYKGIATCIFEHIYSILYL